MQAIYDLLYQPGLPLEWMGFLLGAWLVITHVFALAAPGIVKPFLAGYARNDKLGIAQVIVAFAWAFIVWSCMDLGEFYKVERQVQYILVFGCIGVIVYVREFLAVRSLGFLLILAAAPILTSAFLQEPVTRLLIVALAYVIALKGMFWIGLPWLLRDQIKWVLAEDNRFRIGAAAGAVYGLVVLICAVLWW